MCGRYAFDDIEDIFEARTFLEEIVSNIGSEKAAAVKTGEVFPSETAAVLAQGIGHTAFAWGYPLQGTKRIIINARSETVLDKPMFRKSLAKHKCLVACTGFFEWKTVQGGKQKYIIRPKGEDFFYLAGLYERFYIGGQAQARFVIITAPANESMAEIHERMPLMVPVRCADEWLNSEALDIESIYGQVTELEKKAV